MPNQTCFETIRIEAGQIQNIKWHNQRCNRTRRELFGEKRAIELQHWITPPPEGLYRCRITYHKQITKIEYIPYQPKIIKSFKIVPSTIDYRYKYSERTQLDHLKNQYPEVDEIIIEKDGLITDTTIANLAFYDGEQWVTPENPLLPGTMRAKLLNEKFLIPKPITSEALKQFSHVALMNAMIGFQIQKNSIIYNLTERPILCL